MMDFEFLRSPNIPHGKARLCAVGEGNPEIKSALEELGVRVLEVPAHPALDARVASHADMQLHDMGGGKIAAAKPAGLLNKLEVPAVQVEKAEYADTSCQPAQSLKQSLERLGFTVAEQKIISGVYPNDIALNCFALGGYLYCNEKNTSQILLNYYQAIGIKTARVRQGYARCSVCIVDKSSIITADLSIARETARRGLDVLLIRSGGVALTGYDTGFIGGGCGLIAPDKLAFAGKLSKHPDYIQIRSFCENRGVETAELADMPLTDIGGIIPLGV